jgi:GNAT superfamily N-acetyltransferase
MFKTLAKRSGSAVKRLIKLKTGQQARVVVPISEITIREMIKTDIDSILQTFVLWNKTRQQYEIYWEEQQRGARTILLALHGKNVIGYGTIVWRPPYSGFREKGIPEIVDLNVINKYQGSGIGSALISASERLVAECGKRVIGISVEQTPAYEKPNRLYPKLGYIPDGAGIDSENILHLIKTL